MHSNSLLVAALAAAVSLVSAQEERPRIYFPRHVKRQFVNATMTRQTPHPAAGPTLLVGTAPDTTKRQSTDESLGLPSSSPTAEDTNVTTVVFVSTTRVSPSPSTTESTGDGTASTGGIPDTIIQPTTKSDDPSSSPAPSSTPTSTSSSGILLAPTGIVSSTTSTPDPLGPISSLLSSIVSDLSTAILPSPNTTEPTSTSTQTSVPVETTPPPTTTQEPPTTTQEPPTTTQEPPTTTQEPPTTTQEPPKTTAEPPSSTVEPPTTVPSSEPPLPPTETSSTIVPTLDPVPTFTNTTVPSPSTTENDPPPTQTTPPPTSSPPIPSDPTTTVPTTSDPPPTQSPTDQPPSSSNTTTPIPTGGPTESSTTLPPDPTVTPPPNGSVTNTTGLGNSTIPPPTEAPAPPTSTTVLPSSSTDTKPWWIPSTIVVEESPTETPTGPPSSTPTTFPSGLPRAITPNDAQEPVPEDMVEIQIAFNRGLNYNFVATSQTAASQLLQTLPHVLKYLGPDYKGPEIQTVVRRLQPLNTIGALGYMTTLAICTYPKARIDKLRVEMNLGTSWMWRNPNPLQFNMSQEINTSIDILLGSTLDFTPGGPGGSPPDTPAAGPNGIFNNGASGNEPSPSQRGATAGIAVGAIFISAAYGGAMFIIARRYKKKKQGHRRSSSIANSSEMRQTGSPALMGGALLSRDFTSNYGGVAGPRDSHGSGRSNMNNSGRTAYISAPVAAENSLGWN